MTTAGIKQLLRAARAWVIVAATAGSPYPVYGSFGEDVGTPIDRRFIEEFLARHASAIHGVVLEIGDRAYTRRFGSSVTRSDVLTAQGGAEGEIVADLSCAPEIPDATYDCIILTQTLHYITKMEDAVSEIHRTLKPGGVLLVTVPGVSQISTWDMERWGDRWRLTDLALSELLGARFHADALEVESFGNAASAVAFLQGIPAERVPARVLQTKNPEYPILVAAAARKATK